MENTKIKMGIEDSKKGLDKDTWRSAEEVSEIVDIGVGSVRKHLNSLVNTYYEAKTKTISVNHNWRKVYKLK